MEAQVIRPLLAALFLRLGLTLSLAVCLVTVAAPTPPRPGDLLLCAGGNEMFLMDAREAEQGTVQKLWSWSGDHADGLTNDERPWFHHLDECRAIEGGSKILVTASNSGCAWSSAVPARFCGVRRSRMPIRLNYCHPTE